MNIPHQYDLQEKRFCGPFDSDDRNYSHKDTATNLSLLHGAPISYSDRNKLQKCHYLRDFNHGAFHMASSSFSLCAFSFNEHTSTKNIFVYYYYLYN